MLKRRLSSPSSSSHAVSPYHLTSLATSFTESVFEVVSVESTKCPLDSEERCLFTQDDTPKIRIGFKPGKTNTSNQFHFPILDRDVDTLKAQVRARLDGKYSTFNLENDDACNGQNLTCPLKAGQVYYYSQTVKVVREYPAVSPLKGPL